MGTAGITKIIAMINKIRQPCLQNLKHWMMSQHSRGRPAFHTDRKMTDSVRPVSTGAGRVVFFEQPIEAQDSTYLDGRFLKQG